MGKGIGTMLTNKGTGRTCKITDMTDKDFTVEYTDNKEVKKYTHNNLKNFPVYDGQKDIINELKQTIKEQEEKLAEKDEQIRQLQEKLDKQMERYKKVGRKTQISEEKIKHILEEVDLKTPYREIAKMVGCSISTISFFAQRERKEQGEREDQINKEKEINNSAE